MKRFFCLLLCLLIFLGTLSASVHAEEEGQLHSVLCYTPSTPRGLLCTVLLSGGYIYMTAHTASIICEYDVLESVPGSATFTSGNRTVTHTGTSVSNSGYIWYRMESLMASLNTKVTASAGYLLFNPANTALNELDSVMQNYRQMTVAVDPNDPYVSLGLDLAKAYEIASNFNISALIGHKYERDMYRTAFYALLRRSSDTYDTTISGLCAQAEDEIINPLSTFYKQMGTMFSEEILDSFYSGSELETMKEFIDAYRAYSDVLTMSPAELYSRMEEAAFYNGAFDAGAVGLSYLLGHSPTDDKEELILEVMRPILGSYQQNTSDQIKSVIFDTALDIGAAHVDGLIRDALLGKAGSALLTGMDLLMQQLPGVSAMDELAMGAIFYHIQELARQQIELAYETGDYIRLKYAGIIYYRCAYLAAAEIAAMDDASLKTSAEGLMVRLNELEVRLLAISDHLLQQQSCVNSEIPARALTGPQEEYVAFYESLLSQYGALNERDYFGTVYIEDGSGIITMWLSTAGGKTLFVVLRQEGSQLIQMVYQDMTGNADFALIDERVVLTSGSSGSIYQGFNRAGPLLSCVSYGTSLTAYICTGISIEEIQYFGNPSADSISAMRQDARNQMTSSFGNHEAGFEIDGSDGLFKISHSPEALRSIFLEALNHL